MAANLPPEYYIAEQEYQGAKTREEKVKCLEKMLSAIPQHKASQTVRGEIRRKISLLNKEIAAEARKKKGSRKKGIKKEGAAQICLIGLPNAGKSYILNNLCNKKIPSTETPFETGNPEVGMLDVFGVKVQLIEIPSIYPGFYSKSGESRGLMLNCDFLCFVVKNQNDLDFIKSEIGTNKKFVIVSSKDLEVFKKKIWENIEVIRVYTKEPGKQPEKNPVALKHGAKVEDVGQEIHKEFIKRFRYAKVYRKHDKVKERRVGLNFVLEDGDIVEFHVS